MEADYHFKHHKNDVILSWAVWDDIAPYCPDGYEVSPHNPAVFVRPFPECAGRRITYVEKACCGKVERYICTRRKAATTRQICCACTEKA